MLKIESMIKEKCPDGVEYRKLSEVCNVLRGKRLTKSQLSETKEGGFVFPVLHGGMEPMGYYNEPNRKAGTTIVINTGNAGNVYYSDEPYWSSDACFSLYPKNDTLLDRFLYFFIATKEDVLHGKIRSGAMPTIDSIAVESLVVPIPPLEVQQEIVGILNSFTELEAELEAELTKRKQQFDYYCDKLLSYDSPVTNSEQIKWLPLGEVLISLNTGLNPRQFFRLNTDDATNYYVTIREIKGGNLYITDKTDRINDEALKLCNNRSNLEVGDVLFSGTGTIGETYEIREEPYNWNIKEGVYSLKPISSKILPTYLSYILRAQYIKKIYMKKAAGGTVKSVPMAEMKKLLIPVPSIQEQEKAVSYLNSFNSLTSSLVEGLPAEIEARHKQYEYYRDKLLTFREKVVQ